jgi:DDE superfamily endonuclease
VIAYAAMLDVPADSLVRLTRLLVAHRMRLGTRRGSRAASCRDQALLVLRWFRDATAVRSLAMTTGIAISTAYRYLHEGIDVLAAAAPDLHQVLDQARQRGWSHVALDGTLIEMDRVDARKDDGNHLWYSDKHRKQGGLVQIVADPTGFPVWSSPVEPGATHDITAAREHALGALYKAAADGVPTLADKGYVGAGIGIHVPFKGRNLAIDNQSHNALHSAVRAIGERAHSILKTTWAALQRVTLCSRRIGDMLAAAIVLSQWQRGRY